VLRTPASAYRFIDLLSHSLALNREDTEEGFVVFKPSQESAAVKSEPAESTVEPLPVIAAVLAEGDPQSTDTSIAL